MTPVVSRRFLTFLFVGAVGFLVDGGVLTLLLRWDWGIFSARAVSFLLAVSVTWILNRTWTFGAARYRPPAKQFLGYAFTQIGGGLVNIAVFLGLISAFGMLRNYPLVPLAAGSAMGLTFNYGLARLMVFR